jgi:hypothetical protein
MSEGNEQRPGVNFINILHTAFTLVDPVKAVRRTLMKLSPVADAIKNFTPSLGIPYLGV